MPDRDTPESLKSQPFKLCQKQIDELRELLNLTDDKADTFVENVQAQLSVNFKEAAPQIKHATQKVCKKLDEVHDKIEEAQTILSSLDDYFEELFNVHLGFLLPELLNSKRPTEHGTYRSSPAPAFEILNAYKNLARHQSIIHGQYKDNKHHLQSFSFYKAWWHSDLPTPVTSTKTSLYIKALDIVINGPLPTQERELTARRKNLANQVSKFAWFQKQRGQKTEHLIE